MLIAKWITSLKLTPIYSRVRTVGAYRTVADCHTEATCHTECAGTHDIYSADVHVCYLSTLSAELGVIFRVRSKADDPPG